MKPFDGRKGKRIPDEIISDLRFFAFYIGNGTVLSGTKWGVDYDISIVYEPSSSVGKIFEIVLSKYDSKGNIKKQGKGASEMVGEFIESLNEKKDVETHYEFSNSPGYREVITRFVTDFGQRKLYTAPLKYFKEDYCDDLIDYGSGFERMISIFLNVLRMDKDWNVINEEWARFRASQYIRYYHDRDYRVVPPLKEWETELK